ncbi:DUF1501 domain-containing protein [Undibacterium sp. Ji22W]|uniref:DUF1501 domain-containing protein n=1 Tax=Undibacterium sp. Ji22W TaxID=3413038 RepID=UPI003BF397F6
MNRRNFLKAGGIPLGIPLLAGLGGVSMLSGLSDSLAASTGDYKALICLFLNGGNDGHNTLIPTDAAYTDYSNARPILALPKDSLIRLDGNSAGHSYGLHPGLSPLAALYNKKRLAWIANAGLLIVPSTGEQVINHSVPIPPFLQSHSDATALQQGWDGDSDLSGWAGRTLEQLPSGLSNRLNAVTMSNNRTFVLGRKSSVSFMSPFGARYWGRADLAQPQSYWSQSLNNMARSQFANQYEAEYARTFNESVSESTILTQVFLAAKPPTANFGTDDLASKLSALASVMPVFKSMGYRRQIFLVEWGGFDTHYGQRGNDSRTQDAQLDIVGRAVAAFDQANIAAGMDLNVTTLMLSEFGRTLRPASGAGSDHAWGNNWFVLGGAVAGGQVIGQLPSYILGGVDDADPGRGGRMVPSTSTDQVGATVMQWLGLPTNQLNTVFPNLVNFPKKNLNFMHS